MVVPMWGLRIWCVRMYLTGVIATGSFSDWCALSLGLHCNALFDPKPNAHAGIIKIDFRLHLPEWPLMNYSWQRTLWFLSQNLWLPVEKTKNHCPVAGSGRRWEEMYFDWYSASFLINEVFDLNTALCSQNKSLLWTERTKFCRLYPFQKYLCFIYIYCSKK